MIAMDAVATAGETSALRQSIGIPRASFYRHRQPARRNGRRSSARCTASDSSTGLPRKSMPRGSRSRPPSARRGRCVACWPRPTRSRSGATGRPSGVHQTRAAGDQAQSSVVLGHHQAEGAGEVRRLLAVGDPRPVQLLRRGMDGRGERERQLGGAPHRGHVRQAGHRPASAHDSRGPRRAHAKPTRGAAVLGSGHCRQPLTASREQRLPVLGIPVSDPEVPISHAGRRALRPRRRDPRRPSPRSSTAWRRYSTC